MTWYLQDMIIVFLYNLSSNQVYRMLPLGIERYYLIPEGLDDLL